MLMICKEQDLIGPQTRRCSCYWCMSGKMGSLYRCEVTGMLPKGLATHKRYTLHGYIYLLVPFGAGLGQRMVPLQVHASA